MPDPIATRVMMNVDKGRISSRADPSVYEWKGTIYRFPIPTRHNGWTGVGDRGNAVHSPSSIRSVSDCRYRSDVRAGGRPGTTSADAEAFHESCVLEQRPFCSDVRLDN